MRLFQTLKSRDFRKRKLRTLVRGCAGWQGRKKRVSIFDEQSRYIIENKGPRLRTKPTKANFAGGKVLQN
jgi:hypothetical protein